MTADRPSGKRQTVVAKAGKPRSLIAIVGSVSAAVAQHEPPGAHNTLAPGTAAETRQTTALGADVPVCSGRDVGASRKLIRISPAPHEGALSSPAASTMAASERRGGPAASRRRAFST